MGLEAAGSAAQTQADVYGTEADSLARNHPPAAPEATAPSGLDNMYAPPRDLTPRCVGQVPVSGPGINPCPN
jgi:hypothetical protein